LLELREQPIRDQGLPTPDLAIRGAEPARGNHEH
jgi:hypothetical protein